MSYFTKRISFTVILGLSSTVFANSYDVNSQQVYQEKQQVIHQLVTKDHFSREKLNNLFQTLQPNPQVIEAITKPFEKKPWSFYRNFFLTQERIDLGAQYLKDHHEVLMQMQRKYGIPASIITAIIGIETEYGSHLGTYPVVDALYTLGFYYPPRAVFFRREFEKYLILARDNHLNVNSMMGSYAGALGIPQFMPSSYLSYGVSYRQGEPVNLYNNNDAIVSVANYFHKNGWQANQPIAHELASKNAWRQKTTTLLPLPYENNMQYWAIYKNFNVIMTYNHNMVYAMAVYQLSKKIEKAYAENAKNA